MIHPWEKSNRSHGARSLQSNLSRMIQSSQQHPSDACSVYSRACHFCRARKVKCDKTKPICTTCATHKRHCVYTYERPKPRPSSAIIAAVQNEKRVFENIILDLKKSSSPEQVATILQRVTVLDGSVQLQQSSYEGHENPAQRTQLEEDTLNPPEK